MLFVTCLLMLMTDKLSAQTITLDNYYNREFKKTAKGDSVLFHYLWNDSEQTGFSIFGDAFKRQGAKVLNTLTTAPNLKNLKETDVYIIVDPDNTLDSKNPNYMEEKAATDIAKWVKNGGVLLLMANDEENADLKHFNMLAQKFGFVFNGDLILSVKDDQHFDDGGLYTQESPIFKTAKYIYIKNASAIKINHSAVPVLKTKDNKVAIASAQYGKGMVLAVGDPWLYNEYTNGRLPKRFENDKAANDLAKWLIEHTKYRN